MRRVLVPLDGSSLSEAIIDDAARLAGPGGTLILTQEVRWPVGRAAVYGHQVNAELAQHYLDRVAADLRARGLTVRTLAEETFHVPEAIDVAARTNHVDMIAAATHSRGSIGSLLWGSVAWKVLSQSSVPVLLRHPVSRSPGVAGPGGRHILVPLDGSDLAETALPLAQELATEWHASIDLVRVVPQAFADTSLVVEEDYLTRVSVNMSGEVRRHVLLGDPVDTLVAFAQADHTTDIVMSSHGRTGLARMFMGSVAYEMIRRLPLPVIIVPALVAARVEKEVTAREPVTHVTA